MRPITKRLLITVLGLTIGGLAVIVAGGAYCDRPRQEFAYNPRWQHQRAA